MERPRSWKCLDEAIDERAVFVPPEPEWAASPAVDLRARGVPPPFAGICPGQAPTRYGHYRSTSGRCGPGGWNHPSGTAPDAASQGWGGSCGPSVLAPDPREGGGSVGLRSSEKSPGSPWRPPPPRARQCLREGGKVPPRARGARGRDAPLARAAERAGSTIRPAGSAGSPARGPGRRGPGLGSGCGGGRFRAGRAGCARRLGPGMRSPVGRRTLSRSTRPQAAEVPGPSPAPPSEATPIGFGPPTGARQRRRP